MTKKRRKIAPVKDEKSEPEDFIPDDAIRTVLTFRGALNRPVVVPQDIAEEADRVYRCHMRHLSGESWAEIARSEGYPNISAVRGAVDRYLNEARDLMTAEVSKRMLQTEVDRLDYMQTKIWSQVENGDLDAIKVAITLGDKRVQWQNLTVKDDDTQQIIHTVINPGDDLKSYLMRMARQAESEEVVEGEVLEPKQVTSTTQQVHTEEEL